MILGDLPDIMHVIKLGESKQKTLKNTIPIKHEGDYNNQNIHLSFFNKYVILYLYRLITRLIN